MSYGSMAKATNIVKAFDFFDRLTPEAKAICQRADIGPMQIMVCGLNKDGRSGRITGTDLPKMLGLIDAKYGDLRTTLAEKLDIIKPDRRENTFTRVGKFMEPYLASRAIEILEPMLRARPEGIFRITMGEFFEHPTLRLGVSTDLCLWDEEVLVAVFELKHTGADWDDEGLPDKVIVQVQAQIMCTQMPTITVIALTGGNRDDKSWSVSLDPEWQKEIARIVTFAEDIIVSGKLPTPLTYIPIKAPKVRPVAKVTSTFHRLADALDQSLQDGKKITNWTNKAKKILGRHIKDGETVKGNAGWSVTRSFRTEQPKLNAAKALPAIEQALLDFVPFENMDDAKARIEIIKEACTSDGTQTSTSTFRSSKGGDNE